LRGAAACRAHAYALLLRALTGVSSSPHPFEPQHADDSFGGAASSSPLRRASTPGPRLGPGLPPPTPGFAGDDIVRRNTQARRTQACSRTAAQTLS
jgi:hypothetical protein